MMLRRGFRSSLFALTAACTAARQPDCRRTAWLHPLPRTPGGGGVVTRGASTAPPAVCSAALAGDGEFDDDGAVLVIGGTGLMGAPTARRLRAAGRRVVVLSRGRAAGMGVAGRRPPFPEGCEHVACDREDEAAFAAALVADGCPRIVVDFTAMAPAHVGAVLAAHARRPAPCAVLTSLSSGVWGGGGVGHISACRGRRDMR